jgi:hypothetical protein
METQNQAVRLNFCERWHSEKYLSRENLNYSLLMLYTKPVTWLIFPLCRTHSTQRSLYNNDSVKQKPVNNTIELLFETLSKTNWIAFQPWKPSPTTNNYDQRTNVCARWLCVVFAQVSKQITVWLNTRQNSWADNSSRSLNERHITKRYSIPADKSCSPRC